MSLVRFFNGQTLVTGLVFDGIDIGHDLLKWLCGHPSSGSIEHLACVYRLYARFKFKCVVGLLETTYVRKRYIRLKYDVFMKDRDIVIKARDYATGFKVKGNPYELINYLYPKN